MGIALSTILVPLILLPGVFSYAIATGPRCRALAPRDLPATLVVVLAFTVVDFGLTSVACRAWWDAPSLGDMTAVLLTGEPYQNVSREEVVADLVDGSWQLGRGLLVLAVMTWLVGTVSALAYSRMLRATAIKDAESLGALDPRTPIGRFVDWVLRKLGIQHLAITRGASYWLIVEQLGRLVSDVEREVYADITQGDDSTLFAGQVVQVITSPSGETHSVVLKKARRYRRTRYGVPDAAGKRPIEKEGGWTPIGDSEAFYLRGDNIHNISFRIYGDPARGGYEKVKEKGREWSLPDLVMQILDSWPLDKKKPTQPG